MATREFKLVVDHTTPTIKADFGPQALGMELSQQELEVFRGDDVTIKFEVTQGSAAFDLSGYTVKYQAKTAIGDSSFVFNKTCTVTDATRGKCQAALVGSDIPTAGTLKTQLYITTSGVTQTVLQIPLVVLPSV